jgi:hypothetical protein
MKDTTTNQKDQAITTLELVLEKIISISGESLSIEASISEEEGEIDIKID